ncbi:hypothetical protein RR48_07529 [Papilio machaon]|uniref:Uncharacterized protein n=1 Tax=Papilio machaon TaxID=76193 RepID=A0A194RRP9_PAPMA|nr:hypothetical protein RR48_07529 [Papilio machaon]
MERCMILCSPAELARWQLPIPYTVAWNKREVARERNRRAAFARAASRRRVSAVCGAASQLDTGGHYS